MILQASLKSFPFDIQVLPFAVKAEQFSRQRIKLVDPHARLKDPDYKKAHYKKRGGKGHLVAEKLAMYQFNVIGITGDQDLERSAHGDIYRVDCFVERPRMSNYVWDLLIMLLLLTLAVTSLWSPSPELSMRMSIAMTVLLTTAAYNSNRPRAIELYPDATFHDR